MIVKKQICKVKTDSICVYVNNDTTHHVILRRTAALEVAVNGSLPQDVNVPKIESEPSLKPKLETPNVITSQVPSTKNTAQSHSIPVKEEVSFLIYSSQNTLKLYRTKTCYCQVSYSRANLITSRVANLKMLT